ncbi:MAG: hypothetical protein AAB896_00140, partial [Patescibacteria group bacterium]
STANNSESDLSMSYRYSAGTTTTTWVETPMSRERILTLAAKTSYYLNGKVLSASTGVLFRGDNGTTIIRAVSAYL